MSTIPGTNVAAMVVPFDDLDIYATHNDKYGRGGFRVCDLLTDRDAIAELRRKQGMWVKVVETGLIYELEADLLTWTTVVLGSEVEVFILDVIPTSTGIVGGKTYKPNTVPTNVEIVQCQSDTPNVRVLVGCEGGKDNYSPTILVEGVQATLTESSTKRWFTGYADIVLTTGNNTVTAVSDAGGVDTVVVEVLGAGPTISSVVFGAYPGTQTELKAGDVITVTITTELAATSVTILSQGATTGTTLAVSGGVATGPITISSASGVQLIAVKAQNSFGTFGSTYNSSNLTLNQTYPTFGSLTVAYPLSQGALNTAEVGSVSCVVSNANTVAYSSPNVTIASPSVYGATKAVTNFSSGYVNSGTNYTITATRTANNAVATKTGLVVIATTAPTAGITISPTGRLVSSPTGISYDVRITPSQTLLSAPSLNASHGSWSGSWTLSGSYWHRTLVIADAVTRGTGTFTSLSCTGLSSIVGSTITSGANYTVGGFSSRTVTFPAFSRVAPLGATVADQTKTTAQIGAQTLTRHTDNGVYLAGYYIADSNGAYNPNGSYLGLSDTAFAGSNTSGTLEATVQETA